MQIAAMTSHEALIVSPRLSATMPNDTAPRAAIPAHKSFDCVPFALTRMVTTFLPGAPVAYDRQPTSYVDKVKKSRTRFPRTTRPSSSRNPVQKFRLKAGLQTCAPDLTCLGTSGSQHTNH